MYMSRENSEGDNVPTPCDTYRSMLNHTGGGVSLVNSSFSMVRGYSITLTWLSIHFADMVALPPHVSLCLCPASVVHLRNSNHAPCPTNVTNVSSIRT
jgi:hypothetical protein